MHDPARRAARRPRWSILSGVRPNDPAPMAETLDRLTRLDRPRGGEARRLTIGPLVVAIEGLDRTLAQRLDARWGEFAAAEGRGASCTVRVFVSDDRWLSERPGEPYRMEAEGDGGLVVSERFAVAREPEPGRWRAGVTERPEEPVERIVENVVRLLLGRLAVEAGGFALHAAGVARSGRAYLLAGPSNAGKSTAVSLAAPAESLGDDYGIVLPGTGEWVAAAVPFDNSERAPSRPPGSGGVLPLAGVWRLYKAQTTRAERPPTGVAVATLLGCAVAPWTMPDLSGPMLRQASAFIDSGGYAHLHFARDADLWTVLLHSARLDNPSTSG